jgi:osmotically-inducible protein OsmY
MVKLWEVKMRAPLGDLATRVNAALSDREETAQYPIEAVNDNGVITLSGTVPSDEVRDIAEEVAEEVEGVVDVINDLTIGEVDKESELIVPPINPTRTSNIP